MITRIDNHGNIITKRGQSPYLSGKPALLQNLTNRLRLLKGEAIFEPDAGVDYEYLFNNNNHSLVSRVLTAEIYKDPRVAYARTKLEFKQGTLCVDIEVKED